MSSTDAVGTRSLRSGLLVPALVLIATMVSLFSSLGAPLIPEIAKADHVSLASGQWLLTATLVTGAVMTPVMGRLADGPLQRIVVVSTLAVVLVGCGLSALSGSSFALMVVGRGAQGVGLGLMPVTMAIARQQLPIDDAKQAIAALSITGAIGVGVGYPLTSVIANLFGFHGAFWFGTVFVAAVLVVAVIVLPAPTNTSRRPFDWAGAAALTVSIVGLSVVLSEAGNWGWGSARSIGVLIVSAVLLIGWVRLELASKDPLVDVRQVRNRQVLTADIAGFLLCVALYLFVPVLVEFVQIPTSTGYGFGVSVTVAGVMLMPLSIATFVSSRGTAQAERLIGPRAMIPAGCLIFGLSIGLFAIEHRTLWEAFVVLGIAGLGFGLSFAVMPGLIVGAVAPSETGSAMGFYQVLRSIGLSLGSALSASLLNAYTHSGSPFPTVGGYRTALIVGAAMSVLAAVLSYALPTRTAVRRGVDAAAHHRLPTGTAGEADGTGLA